MRDDSCRWNGRSIAYAAALRYNRRNAQRFLRTAPGLAFYHGLLISLTVIRINFVGDGLRDALDSRLRL